MQLVAPHATTLASYKWAPVGKKLLFTDATGTHVVDVDAGTPGQPVDVDSSAQVWSPTGAALAGSKNSIVYFTTLNGTPATVALTPTTGLYGFFVFNHDGSQLAFQDGNSAIDVMRLRPSVGEIVHPHGVLPIGTTAVALKWSPQANWVSFKTNYMNVPSWHVTDLSGGAPAAPLAIDALGVTSFVWSTVASPQLYGVNTATSTIDTFDPNNPGVVPLVSATDVGSLTVNPSGTVVAYATTHALHLIDAHTPQDTPIDVPIDSGFDGVGMWQWSSDDKFIAVVDKLTSYGPDDCEQALFRVDGALASTPIRLGGHSDTVISFALQP